MTPKPDFCRACPISHVTGLFDDKGNLLDNTQGYVKPLMVEGSTELWVGEANGAEEAKSGLPFNGGAGSWLDSLCRSGKIDRSRVSMVNCIGCRPPENVFPTDVKWHATDRARGREAVGYCFQHHVKPALESKRWTRIVALGDRALEALTDRKGILIWRGSALPLKDGLDQGLRTGEIRGPKVMPTLHPAYIARQASMFPIVVGDLKRNLNLPPENYNLYATEVREHLGKDLSFDFEWDYNGNITVCGLSSKLFAADVFSWSSDNIGLLRQAFEQATSLVGHNIIGADIGYLDKLNWDIGWEKIEIWDTMLMQHLVQPDYRHSLAVVASIFTKKVFWKGHGEEEEDEDGNIVGAKVQWQTWDSPTAISRQFGGYGGCRSAEEAFRLYNARDTDAAYQIAIPLRSKLEQYGLMGVYQNVSVPVAFVCRDIGNFGIKIDHRRLKDIREIIDSEIETLDKQLPEGLHSYEVEVMKNEAAPEGTYREKVKTCKGGRGALERHEPCKYTFRSPGEHIVCECGKVLVPGKMCLAKTVKVARSERIVPWNSTKQVLQYAAGVGAKEVVNRKSGRVTADKNARKRWQREHPEFVLVDALKKNITLRNSFAKDALFGVDRMYFNLLVHGTAEGRLSSSGRRKGVDLNIQNQPKKIRRIFVPDFPDWGILNPDWVQGENMITAWLAQDMERWKRLHTEGYNEHLDFAERLFGQRVSKTIKSTDGKEVDNPLYICAKRINHGRNYGMGVRKQQETLAAEGFNYSEGDIKEFIKIWRIMMAGTARWQDNVIALAEKQSFLRNAFGRARWFQSRDFATKALAFLPASTLADICLRCMIAMNLDLPRCAQSAGNLGIGVTYQLPRPWRLMAQIHDALPMQGPDSNHLKVAYGVNQVMTQPWPELNGFHLDVDWQYSQSSWGECKTIEV